MAVGDAEAIELGNSRWPFPRLSVYALDCSQKVVLLIRR